MLRKAKSPVEISLKRAGGSIIVAQVDVWRASETGWQLVGQFKFNDATKSPETQTMKMTAGQYTCVFQCFVQESLNGKYDFELDVDGVATFADDGDVNTTPSNDDSKVYKDEFILVVEGKNK